MLFIVSTFVGSIALQKIAVDEVGSVIANAVRLAPVVLLLSMMATYNMDFLLGSDTRVPSRSPKSLAVRRRRRAQQRPGPMSHLFRMPRCSMFPTGPDTGPRVSLQCAESQPASGRPSTGISWIS